MSRPSWASGLASSAFLVLALRAAAADRPMSFEGLARTAIDDVEVVAFPRNTAKSLLEAADRFHPLDRRSMIRTEGAAAEPPPKPPAEAPAER